MGKRGRSRGAGVGGRQCLAGLSRSPGGSMKILVRGGGHRGGAPAAGGGRETVEAEG